jgi:hypothetical protein
VLTAALVSVLVTACEVGTVTEADRFTDAERAAISALTARNPGWRLAEERDNAFPEGIREQRTREPRYHPYRRRGDWNRDGVSDLAVVLVRDSMFQAYWLPGAPTGFGAAESLGETPELRWGGLFEHDGGLLLGPFQSDAVWVYRWNDRTGTLEIEENDL